MLFLNLAKYMFLGCYEIWLSIFHSIKNVMKLIDAMNMYKSTLGFTNTFEALCLCTRNVMVLGDFHFYVAISLVSTLTVIFRLQEKIV